MTIPTAADVDAAVKKQSASENDDRGTFNIPLLKALLKNIVSSIGTAITGDVPIGGTTGQALRKASNTSLDATWQNDPAVAYSSLSGKPTLGTAADNAEGDFATAAQGTKADNALPTVNLAAAVAALGMPRVVGPYIVDYTNFVGEPDGLKKTIATFPVETNILDWWVDPATYVHPEQTDGASVDAFLGQGAAWDPNVPQGQWGEPWQTGDCYPYQDNGMQHSSAIANGNGYDASGNQINVTTGGSWKWVIADSSPIQLWMLGSGGGAHTQGHIELYFEVCTPVAP